MISTTAPPDEKYTTPGTYSNPDTIITSGEDFKNFDVSVQDSESRRTLPIGPIAHAQVETKDYREIVNELLEAERVNGHSSVAMFERYIHGDHDENGELEEWFDLFFGFLSSEQVARYICSE